MVKIRVKVTAHDGTSRKPNLINCICQAEVLINKIIESKDAFFLLTDHSNMDKLLGDDVRSKFAEEGLEVQYPPEYEAARTVMLRNVDLVIASKSSQEIIEYIDPSLKVKTVIKIPNNTHLLKLIFESADMADKVVQEGLILLFQKFEKGNIEKEMFVSVVPCYKCYSYAHLKRNCVKPQDYLICSICAGEGHYYTECQDKDHPKCINCVGDHRTLAAKCPKRKEVIKIKVRERRAKSGSVVRSNIAYAAQPTTLELTRQRLPENYLAVMAAAITLSEKRETETPGSFQFIIDEMMKANDMPRVKFPQSVIHYKPKETVGAEGRESRKRQRSSNGTKIPTPRVESVGRGEYVLGKDMKWYPRSRTATPTSTPSLTPSLSMAPTPAPTPNITPNPTPTTSPMPSPPRTAGATPKKQKEVEKDPGLILIVRTDVVLSDRMNNHQLRKEVEKAKIMKYVYTNVMCNQEVVKKNFKDGKYELTRVRKLSFAFEHFNQIKNGGLYKLGSLEKTQRK